MNRRVTGESFEHKSQRMVPDTVSYPYIKCSVTEARAIPHAIGSSGGMISGEHYT